MAHVGHRFAISSSNVLAAVPHLVTEVFTFQICFSILLCTAHAELSSSLQSMSANRPGCTMEMLRQANAEIVFFRDIQINTSTSAQKYEHRGSNLPQPQICLNPLERV